ncbi:argininosuccinate lyase [Clostridium cellulovorans]|uniref:Argininosuccinate lyase n=1 Tax=Clostridium cellulovorans (strain ATCC 35296 / DSM 3052 / OCM 3 / 743B) TaxID=573061 RepID=D9SVE2_CLOC7|nr:argininosuccinate lyase [Clostridium cellulovorans]ADL51066.1 argininosuccinate lyase [Clostridium cellulovorans 743B]
MKLWGGRFSKETDTQVNDFNSSIAFDSRMYKEDILGSIAHVTMLGDQGIIEVEEANEIKSGLLNILTEIEEGKIEFSIDAEDIHMNIETKLIEKIGDVGKKLHTARSRNDQVALDLRMYLKKEVEEISGYLLDIIETLVNNAKANTETIMPGYTHLQRAQPITFAHHLMAYVEMFRRDYGRIKDCYERMNYMPLGSGALATSTYPIDRQKVADILGFNGITLNSLDSVSDRDFTIELASAISIIMMHLSRFSEEIILWCSSEFAFITLDDAYSTGSSIMPQKKNPDVAELVRGKSGRVFGDLMGLLTMMKGIPLAYDKDMQEDKEAIFDAVDTVKLCLPVFTKMVETMTVNKENMRRAAGKGFTNATDAADYLVKKGLPFREAHHVIGTIVAYCTTNQKEIEELTLEEFKSFSDIFQEDVYKAISLETCVNERKVPGGPSFIAVNNHIAFVEEYLKGLK